MELRHLRLVRILAEQGTLTSAGKSLCLSQSALSHQLREIEEEFGAPLFKRTKRRMALTTVGKLVLEGAGFILDEFQRLHDDVRRMTTGEVGTLRLGASSHTGFHWLPAVMQSFKKAYPGVDIRINSAATVDPAGYLLRGVVDLIIENIKIASPRILYKKLFDDEMLALVHRDHRWAGRSYVTAEDFTEENLINYDHSIEDVVLYQRVLRPAGVNPKSLTKLSITEAIVELVRAGVGVAVLSRWSIRPYLGSPELSTVSVTRDGFKRSWYAAVLRDEYQPPYVAYFTDCLSSHEDNF